MSKDADLIFCQIRLIRVMANHKVLIPCLLPMKRDQNKLKYLAGIEQISGLMLSDIVPEDAASKLKSIKID